MEQIVWSPQMALGIPSMDKEHKELLDEFAQLANTPDSEFGAGLFKLTVKLERDFRAEEELMEKIDFPGLLSHREQHARVLGAMHHVIPEVMKGNYALGREAVRLFPQWFLFHLSTMDAVLAFAINGEGMPAISQENLPPHDDYSATEERNNSLAHLHDAPRPGAA